MKELMGSSTSMKICGKGEKKERELGWLGSTMEKEEGSKLKELFGFGRGWFNYFNA